MKRQVVENMSFCCRFHGFRGIQKSPHQISFTQVSTCHTNDSPLCTLEQTTNFGRARWEFYTTLQLKAKLK